MLLDDTGSIFYFISGVMLLEKLSIHISPPTKLMDAKPLAYRGYCWTYYIVKQKWDQRYSSRIARKRLDNFFFFFGTLEVHLRFREQSKLFRIRVGR